MGRLIDADKLKAQFPEPADWLDINQALVHKTGIWAEIDAAETVEAIPVDWINRFLDWLEKVNNDMSLRDAKGIRIMLAQWRTGRYKFDAPEGCGGDSCNISK